MSLPLPSEKLTTLIQCLPDAPFKWHLADEIKAYGQACRADLVELVAAVHKAKGRYHSQIAMCNLYEACGLPNTRPTK